MATYEDKLTLAAFNALAGGEPGTCKLVWGTYVGTGAYGRNNPTVPNFPSRPLYVRVTADSSVSSEYLIMYRCKGSSDGSYAATVSWTEKGLSYYSTTGPTSTGDPATQMNSAGQTYVYVALLGI